MVGKMSNLAISANSVAQAVAYVISQPDDVDVNEMIIRGTAQPQ
jgi:NADP-dependent 3-hydroxy acid dehydrogenase YdfG